jgi:phosphoribosyl-AMP cyclohydrolase
VDERRGARADPEHRTGHLLLALRGTLWVKGETSGHHQYVRSVALDCDGDALLVRVDQVGVACHTGERTCFHNTIKTIEQAGVPQ